MNRTVPAALALLLGLTLSGCASDDTTTTEPAAASESAAASEPSASAMEK